MKRKDPGGISCTEFDQAFKRDEAAAYQTIHREAHTCFQTNDAKRRLIVFEGLLIRMVRGMIRGDRVNRSITQAFADRFDVILTAQRRTYLGVRVVSK